MNASWTQSTGCHVVTATVSGAPNPSESSELTGQDGWQLRTAAEGRRHISGHSEHDRAHFTREPVVDKRNMIELYFIIQYRIIRY